MFANDECRKYTSHEVELDVRGSIDSKHHIITFGEIKTSKNSFDKNQMYRIRALLSCAYVMLVGNVPEQYPKFNIHVFIPKRNDDKTIENKDFIVHYM